MFRWILKSIVRSSYKIQFKTQQKRRVLLTSKCCEILIVKSVLPLQSWSFHRQEEWNDFVIILSHIDPQGLKAAPVCLCKYSSLPVHFWWCIHSALSFTGRHEAGYRQHRGLMMTLLNDILMNFTRYENNCKQWFTLIIREQNKFSDNIWTFNALDYFEWANIERLLSPITATETLNSLRIKQNYVFWTARMPADYR